jgi:hypothetical protein
VQYYFCGFFFFIIFAGEREQNHALEPAKRLELLEPAKRLEPLNYRYNVTTNKNDEDY